MAETFEDKPWGQVNHLLGASEPASGVVFALPEADLQVDKLTLRAGGFSSLHVHTNKTNLFILVSGEVDVVHYKRQATGSRPTGFETPEELQTFIDTDARRSDAWRESHRESLAAKGDTAFALAGSAHSFEVKRDAVLLEVYWSTMPGEGVKATDIVRFRSNGKA